MSQQGTEKSIFRVIFRIGFGIRTAMILQNAISRFNLFRIESFDSGVCYLGELRKQICWMSQQGTQNSVFRVIFRIGFSIRTAMILQNTISRFNLFRIESFDTWVCYFGEPRNNTKVRVIFRIGFGVITTMILYPSSLPHKGTKKKCWMSQQITEEHFEHVLSSLCMLISVCAFKLVYVFSWLVALVVHNVSLASLVPISCNNYINNSPLSSTLRAMTILKYEYIYIYIYIYILKKRFC